MTSPRHVISTVEALEALYQQPLQPAVLKEVDYIPDGYRQFIERAPCVVVATSGPGGLDCSPRGDPAGFVRVLDSRRVMIPDRRGNNRLDSLRNLLVDPRISLLFLIPGIGETLRINGHAQIIVDPELAASFAINDKTPCTLIEVTVDSVYTQCPKALIRSKLWDPSMHIARSELPTGGQMLAAISKGRFDGAEHDRAYPERLKQTIY